MAFETEAKEVLSLLKKNGGPLALRAASIIKELLKSAPKQPRGELHPYHKAIVLLFQNRLNKPHRDQNEVRVFKSIKKLINQEELENLKRFYKQKAPKSYHPLLSRRKNSPITFMRSYVDQVFLAEKWCKENPPPPDPQKTSIPETENWQQHAPGNLGNMSWYLVCREYPDIAKDISEAVKNNCKAS